MTRLGSKLFHDDDEELVYLARVTSDNRMAQFWNSLKRRLAERNKSSFEESTRVDVGYLNLEPRRVLSADFMLVGGMLDLDDFSQTTDENLTISEFANFYRFDLDEGTWSGVDTAFLNGLSLIHI